MRRFISFNPLFLLFALIAALQAGLWEPAPPPVDFDPDRVVQIQGRIVTRPEYHAGTLFFELKPEKILQDSHPIHYFERIQVYLSVTQSPVTSLRSTWVYGDILSFTTYLKQPAYFSLPGVPDYRELAWLRGTSFRVSLKSELQVRKIGHSSYWPLGRLHRYFASFEEACRRRLAADRAQLILLVLLNRSRAESDALKELAEGLGIYHLLVVSGFHIAVILLFLGSILSQFGLAGRWLCLLCVWAYVIGLGMPLAALRAALMFSLTAVLHWQGLCRHFANAIGFAGIVVLIFLPRSLYSAGFQFSFLALCAIALMVLPLWPYARALRLGARAFRSQSISTGRDPEARFQRRVRYAAEDYLYCFNGSVAHTLVRVAGSSLSYLASVALSASCIPMLLLPLSLYYGNIWVWSYPLSNLILIPLFSALIASSFLLFLTFWTPAGVILFAVTGQIVSLVLASMKLLEGLASPIYLPQPGAGSVLIYLLFFSTGWLALSRRKRLWLAILPLGLMMGGSRPLVHNRGWLEVTLLDVGQGESLHLRYPDGSNALVDTGGFPYTRNPSFVGRRLLGRYLWEVGVHRLRYVLLTHPDIDHTQGLGFLGKAFPIDRLLFFEPKSAYQGNLHRLQRGAFFRIAGVDHRVLHPPSSWRDRTGNQASLVLEVSYGGFNMLLTGDIGGEVERRLSPDLRPVVVLKVPHHGSGGGTSTELLEKTRPRYAWISAGRSNAFGHPHASVLSRLLQQGTIPLTTSELGSLRVRTDGKVWMLDHYSLDSRTFQPLLVTRSDMTPKPH